MISDLLPTDLAPAARFLVDVLWQSTAWLVLALLVARLLDRRADRAHRVVLFGLAAALITPIVTAAVRLAGLGALPPDAGAHATPRDLPPALAQALDVPQSFGVQWDTVAAAVWALASLYLVGRLIFSTLAGRRLLRGATPFTDPGIERLATLAATRLGLRATPRAVSSSRVACPMVWCWRSAPIVLVPARRLAQLLDDDSREGMTAVLCHELAHWMRRDHLAALLGEVAIAVLPWHPLVWAARRRLHDLGEAACDEWVLAGGTPATTYAEALLDLVPTPRHSLALAAVTARRGLAGRVRRILGSSPVMPDRGPAWSLVVIALTTTLIASFAAAQRRDAAVPDGVVRVRTTPTDAPAIGVRFAGVVAVPAQLDLGAVPAGEAAVGIIQLVNTDDAPRRLARARTTCGCTTLGPIEPTDLKPGVAWTIDVAITASGESGSAKTKSVIFEIEGQDPVTVPVTVRVE